MKYSFHSAAAKEFRKAAAYHQRESKTLGQAFVDEVDAAIQRILESPYRWPELEIGTRICTTKKFKYGLVYVLESEEVVIMAVMHLHRKPGYWKRRLKRKPR